VYVKSFLLRIGKYGFLFAKLHMRSGWLSFSELTGRNGSSSFLAVVINFGWQNSLSLPSFFL